MYAIHEFGDERLDIIKYLYNEGGVRSNLDREPFKMSILHKVLLTRRKVQIKGVVKMLVEAKENINAIEGRERYCSLLF